MSHPDDEANPPAPYPTAPYPTWSPYPPPQPPYPGPVHRSRVPTWLWPVVAVTALVVGLLGGVLGGAIVGFTLDSSSDLRVIGTDNGAAPPLKADNGSVAAVAARVLPSTVQVLARGGSDGQPGGGATGSGFVLDDQGHVITNNHVVAQATGGVS